MAAAAAAPTQRAMSSDPPGLSSIVEIETTVVAPPPSSSLPESSLPLTFYDVFWLNSPPVEHVFVYRLAPGDDIAAILSKLKESLSHAVLAYYALAGRLRLTPGTTNRYELYYRPGDGVTFTVAECDGVDVDELATDEPREVARIVPLVPRLPKGGAVLAIQATVVRRGLAIGFALNHAACNGASSTPFRHSWSAACTGTVGPPPPPPPVLDRSLMPNASLYDNFLRAALSADEMERVKVSHDNLLATFTVCRDDLQRIKEVVAGEATRRGEAPPPRCSSLVAAIGFIWSCHQQAKDDGASNGDPTYILLPVDHRSRRKPPVPAEYFGNCIGAATHAAPKDELAATGAGGLFTACTAVAAAIEEAVAGIESYSYDVDFSRNRVREAIAAGVLAVAGSPRFRLYEVDFGFGRPAKVEIVSVARTGAMAVVESRSSAGGMEVGISLPAAGMKRFQKCFADAIAFLRRTCV